MRLPFQSILVGVGVWLVLTALVAISLLPRLPSTWGQWIALVVFGPPVYVLLEGIGTWLFAPKPGEPIVAKPFSIRRVGLTIVSAIVAAVIVGIAYASYVTA